MLRPAPTALLQSALLGPVNTRDCAHTQAASYSSNGKSPSRRAPSAPGVLGLGMLSRAILDLFSEPLLWAPLLALGRPGT